MIKYVVNSGGLRHVGDHGQAYFREIVTGLGPQPKVLFCFFASPREDWETKFPEYQQGFIDLMPAKVQPEITLAYPETFAEQIKASDAVYLHGGDDHLLLYWLRQFDIPAIWEGKTVATNSASSHALSKYFWTCDWRQCIAGLSVLPIKFIAHYQSDYGADDPLRGPIDWQKASAELAAYGEPDMPTYALREGEYKIFEV